nr:7-cyano-7-deazaguanine synthase [Verrucomicrobiota bacterium]
TYAGVELLRPFIAMTKADIVRRGRERRVDYARTWSCYAGGETHCGECGTCVERREAFLLAGVPDPTVYRNTGPLPRHPERSEPRRAQSKDPAQLRSKRPRKAPGPSTRCARSG